MNTVEGAVAKDANEVNTGDKGGNKRKDRSPLEQRSGKKKVDTKNMDVLEIQVNQQPPPPPPPPPKEHKDPKENKEHKIAAGLERSMKKMAASLVTLEKLYATLDGKLVTLQSDLEDKMGAMLEECKGRMDRVEGSQKKQEDKNKKVDEKLEDLDDRLAGVEKHLEVNSIPSVQSAVLDLTNKLGDLEGRLDQAVAKGNGIMAEELKRIICDMSRQIEYLKAKLKKHDKQFLDVNADLRDRHLVINGIQETDEEDLLDIVLGELDMTIPNSAGCDMEITRWDIDMVYRSGKQSHNPRFPRPITVVFYSKGLKQNLMYLKKKLGWDNQSKISYTDDMSYDVRQHRDVLKSVANRAQYTDHTVRMAGNKIIVDDITYCFDDLDILPVDLKDGTVQQKNVKGGIAFRGKGSFLSNFYPVKIVVEGERYAHVEQYFQHERCIANGEYNRANKILSTDDPVHIKQLGDSCEDSDDWVENRIETLFKGNFYKYAQHENLAMKLFDTGENGLFEATTDTYFGCGIGFNSKKWTTGDWIGKKYSGAGTEKSEANPKEKER